MYRPVSLAEIKRKVRKFRQLRSQSVYILDVTMYPVQSMRRFVCDRLTAAAQEILGAFEKRVEEYESEIARQRRLLDTVFTPEIKLQDKGRSDYLESCYV